MILSGTEIINQVNQSHIVIDPFDSKLINPNSYNYRLGDIYTYVPPDHSVSHIPFKEHCLSIPSDGLVLKPGYVYLATTYERIGSTKFVTILIGRSSIGRLGLFLEISADLGNLGPAHKWTLELTCIQPVIKPYPFVKTAN